MSILQKNNLSAFHDDFFFIASPHDDALFENRQETLKRVLHNDKLLFAKWEGNFNFAS